MLKKILILGGTGAMGLHLTNLLADSGFSVAVTSRKYRISNNDNIKYVQGDAQSIEFLKSLLLDKWDAIIDFMSYKTNVFIERHHHLLNSTSHYLFLSSSRVYADTSIEIVETTPRLLDVCSDIEFTKTNEYPLRKARQEDVLIKSVYSNWTIIRPYITYSENRLQLGVFEKEDWLYRGLNGRCIVFPKDMLNKKTTMTYGLDVSKAIYSLIGKSDAKKEIFNISSSTSITWGEILSVYTQVIEDRTGLTIKIDYVSLDNFFRYHPGKYSIIYDRLFNRVFDNSKISKYCKTNKFTQVQFGLKECLESFLDNPTFNDINWVKEALKDRVTGERTSFKEIKSLNKYFKYIFVRDFYYIYMTLKKSTKWKNTLLTKLMLK